MEDLTGAGGAVEEHVGETVLLDEGPEEGDVEIMPVG